MRKNKSLMYDISAVNPDPDKNLMCQLYLSGDVPSAVKIYGEVDKHVIRSLCLPESHTYHKASRTNQKSCYIVADDSIIDVYADLNRMKSYAFDDPDQSIAKWVGILIDTGKDSLVGLKYNGNELTEADENESKFVGGSKGTLVLWIKAETLIEETKIVTISGDDYPTKSMTVKVHNISNR